MVAVQECGLIKPTGGSIILRIMEVGLVHKRKGGATDIATNGFNLAILAQLHTECLCVCVTLVHGHSRSFTVILPSAGAPPQGLPQMGEPK